MIKKLHLYIIKEFLGSFLFGLVVFSMLLILDQVFQLVDLFLSKGVPFFLVVKLLALILPNILTLAIPMGVLFGILISYGRLSEDNEITAMKANSIDYKTLSVPIIVFICLISFFLIFFNHFLSPAMHKDFRNLYEDIIKKRPLVKFDEKTIMDLGDYQIYADKVNSTKNTLTGVSIYKFDTNNENKAPAKNLKEQQGTWRISAASGDVKVYSNGVQLILYNGYWQKAHPSNINNMIHMTFQKYNFFISMEQEMSGQSSSVMEMSSPEIKKKINEHKNLSLPYHAYAREYWQRWIFALAPIAFVLIAIPIGIMSGKGGKAIGFGISLGVLLLYYVILLVVWNLSEKGLAPTGIVMWFPNITVSALGIYLFSKMVKR